jgi:hypothetical protein
MLPMTTCPNCAFMNAPGSTQCASCGAPLVEAYSWQAPPPPPVVEQAPPAPPLGQWSPPAYGPVLQTPFAAFSPGVVEAQKEAKKALIASIVGIFCCGLVLGILSIKWGNEARRTLDALGVVQGRNMAVAAMALGAVDVLLWAVWLLVQISTR